MKKILLTKGYFAIVDDEDFEYISQWKWRANLNSGAPSPYAARSVYLEGKKTTIYMHRVILSAIKGQYVDHQDHDTLNNSKANIKLVEPTENKRNSLLQKNNKSGVCGVRLCKRNGKWMADIGIDKKVKNLGVFSSFDDAVSARMAANIKYGFHQNHGMNNE